MIRAITFDLWDTVIDGDSDEPKRATRGLLAKPEQRRAVTWASFDREQTLDRGVLDLAYDTMEAAFDHVWHEQHVTWTVEERLEVLCRGLGRALPESSRAALVRSLEEMEIEVMPDPIDDIGVAITSLASNYPLAVVSDAIYSPGRCLREWLERHGLKRHFKAFAFSDEVGHAKPHRDMFAHVAGELGVALPEILHIGDREHNDIQGPHRLGMKAILFTASRAQDRGSTTADAVCESAHDLPATVERVIQTNG